MRTIVVGYGSDLGSRDALALGRALRRLLGARMIVVTAAADPLGIESGALIPGRLAEAHRILEVAEQQVDDLTDVSFRVEVGTSPARVLQRVAEQTEAELIVVGATHRMRIAELVFSSVTHQVLQAAPCAVAVASAGFAEIADRPFAVVGAAFDDSDEGAAAVRAADAMAAAAGARLEVLHAARFGPRPFATDAALYVDLDYEAEARRIAERSLRKGAELARDPEAVEARLLEDSPVSALIDATAELDLLFMGSRAYGPTRRVLLGSVSGNVLRRAHCPVVVLPRPAVARDAPARSTPASEETPA